MTEEKIAPKKKVAKKSTANKPATKSVKTELVNATQKTDKIIKPDTPIAKAGKRSIKALTEEKEKIEKEERKIAKVETIQPTAKNIIQQTRSKLERRSKNYREAYKLIDKNKKYSAVNALDLAIKSSKSKFDSTVEIHVRLNVDPRQADQNIRDMVVLPAGNGKTIRVAVFADVDNVDLAKKAGADIAGGDEFLQQLDKGIIDFDILIAKPSMMVKLGKYARVLGPKGLMPNPKSGTVTNDIAKAVKEAKSGRVEYRVDSTGIVHLGVGKTSFGTEKLLQNTKAVLASIKNNKPASIKNAYVKSIYITTSMGPSIAVEASEL